ncbi:MAG: methyltransferase [Polyangiaceae bacterium]
MTSRTTPLPDVNKLEILDATALDELRKRFVTIGFGRTQLEPILRAAESQHGPIKEALLRFGARKVKEPFAYVARALMFADPVGRDELTVALGDLTKRLEDAGLLVETPEGLVSPYSLSIASGLFLLGDVLSHAGDAVMAQSPATGSLATAVMPKRKVDRALDLGTGAGMLALLLSRKASAVVGTDINPRAVRLARFNARLNGIQNVEFREGNLFEPVRGERFDVVVSQPPFVPQATAAQAGAFMSGGARGDELLLALLKELPSFLAPAGRAVLFAEWGHGPRLPSPVDRIEKAFAGAAVNSLVFVMPPAAGVTHAIGYAAALEPELGAAFEAELAARITHLESMNIEALIPTLIAVERTESRGPRVEVIPMGPFGRMLPNTQRIDKLFAGRHLIRSLDGLLAAKLRMVDGVVLREEQQGPGADRPSQLFAIFPPAAMSDPVTLTPMQLRLSTTIHEAASVREGLDIYVHRSAPSETSAPSQDERELLKATVEMVLMGLLEAA